MKKYFFIVLCFLNLGVSAQSDSLAVHSSSELWQQANQAFTDGQYPLSAATYEAILGKGERSAKLYYNLGNAYFQQNQLGKAILNYTRASIADPSDEDIAYNLALATARTKDKIEAVPEFFLQGWLRDLGLLMPSNSWAFLALILGGFAFGGVVLWLISGVMAWRKAGFATGVVGSLLFVGCIAYCQVAATREYDSHQAIVMNTAAPVKSAPASSGKDIFVLHEGTKVEQIQTLSGWSEIMLPDGNKGWINSTAIELL